MVPGQIPAQKVSRLTFCSLSPRWQLGTLRLGQLEIGLESHSPSGTEGSHEQSCHMVLTPQEQEGETLEQPAWL